jgi:phosphoribosylformimino-5-aminoimidazole carboxamide ribotide isomerase
MSLFTIYPAIDLREGNVVRLRQGKSDQQTLYSKSPGEVAAHWTDQGAEWLHVVNLDGAFGNQSSPNQAALEGIMQAVEGRAKIQMGGGLRSLEDIEKALKKGISRAVLGTAVIENPSFGEEVLAEFGGGRIAFGLDAVDGKLMSRGWQANTGLDLFVLSERLAESGAQTLIYTNILKDGMETGVDWQIASDLSQRTKLDVIASGGTVSLQDISDVRDAGLAGVIVGRALYEGNFQLKEALNAG